MTDRELLLKTLASLAMTDTVEDVLEVCVDALDQIGIECEPNFESIHDALQLKGVVPFTWVVVEEVAGLTQ